MNSLPYFTIITVCYNSEKTIKHTLKSVASQTFKSYEHIIIDGQSSDKTMDIIHGHLQGQLMVLSEPDDGIYDAMNKGIALSKGKIIVLLNSDDTFVDANVLETLYLKFCETNADVVYSSINYVNSLGKILSTWRPKNFKIGDYKNGFHVPHPGFFATREMYMKLGNFNIDRRVAADFDLMLRFMEHADTRCSRLDKITVAMRTDGESSTLHNIIIGWKDIKNSFKNSNIQIVMPVYAIKRYGPKIVRKLQTVFLSR